MIDIIIHVKTSKRDTNGNCYHFGVVWNTAKDRNERVVVDGLGGEGNAHGIAHELVDREWERTLVICSTLPIREWQREHKRLIAAKKNGWVSMEYEGSSALTDALSALMRPTENGA